MIKSAFIFGLSICKSLKNMFMGDLDHFKIVMDFSTFIVFV